MRGMFFDDLVAIAACGTGQQTNALDSGALAPRTVLHAANFTLKIATQVLLTLSILSKLLGRLIRWEI